MYKPIEERLSDDKTPLITAILTLAATIIWSNLDSIDSAEDAAESMFAVLESVLVKKQSMGL